MDSEKFKRVKYLRALERFSRVIIRNLKREDFDEEKFSILVRKNVENLQKVEAVFLDNAYGKALCEFANLAAKTDDKAELLRAANMLEKLKNSKTYKKQKHKNSGFDEY